MRLLKNDFNVGHFQYYVVMPRDRARLKQLLDPLPARETEELFKDMMERFFRAKPNDAPVLDRIRFCAFKNALAIVRATPENQTELQRGHPELPRYQKRLDAAKARLQAYEEALAAIKAAMPPKDEYIVTGTTLASAIGHDSKLHAALKLMEKQVKLRILYTNVRSDPAEWALREMRLSTTSDRFEEALSALNLEYRTLSMDPEHNRLRAKLGYPPLPVEPLALPKPNTADETPSASEPHKRGFLAGFKPW